MRGASGWKGTVSSGQRSARAARRRAAAGEGPRPLKFGPPGGGAWAVGPWSSWPSAGFGPWSPPRLGVDLPGLRAGLRQPVLAVEAEGLREALQRRALRGRSGGEDRRPGGVLGEEAAGLVVAPPGEPAPVADQAVRGRRRDVDRVGRQQDVGERLVERRPAVAVEVGLRDGPAGASLAQDRLEERGGKLVVILLVDVRGAAGGGARGDRREEPGAGMAGEALRGVPLVVDDVRKPAGVALHHHQRQVDARVQLVELGGELPDRERVRVAGHDQGGVPGGVAMRRVGPAVAGEVEHQALARRQRPADDLEPGVDVGDARRPDQARQPDLLVPDVGLVVVHEDHPQRAGQSLVVAVGEPILDRVPRAAVAEVDVMPRVPQADARQHAPEVLDVPLQRDLVVRRRAAAERHHVRPGRDRRGPASHDREGQPVRESHLDPPR